MGPEVELRVLDCPDILGPPLVEGDVLKPMEVSEGGEVRQVPSRVELGRELLRTYLRLEPLIWLRKDNSLREDDVIEVSSGMELWGILDGADFLGPPTYILRGEKAFNMGDIIEVLSVVPLGALDRANPWLEPSIHEVDTEEVLKSG